MQEPTSPPPPYLVQQILVVAVPGASCPGVHGRGGMSAASPAWPHSLRQCRERLPVQLHHRGEERPERLSRDSGRGARRCPLQHPGQRRARPPGSTADSAGGSSTADSARVAAQPGLELAASSPPLAALSASGLQEARTQLRKPSRALGIHQSFPSCQPACKGSDFQRTAVQTGRASPRQVPPVLASLP